MTLADIYLICFLVGFGLSMVSALSGSFHHGHLGSGHGGGYRALFGFANMAAFLAWFGGAGYLLTRFSGIWLWFAFLLAIGGGIVGGAIVFWISLKLMAQERPLDPADYEMVGVLGQLTSAIRQGGIGEVGFSQNGSRRSAPARSDDGNPILKGTEVLVTRYEKGIAYVRRWEDLNDAHDAHEASDAKETL
jgi:membrane protein implicated in regulation of membrane protease activity